MGSKAFPEIAYIEWWDAVSEAGWETVDKTDVQLVLSIGFVVAEDDKAICIAAAVSDEQSNSRMQIPKGMINSVKRVRLNKFLDIRKKKLKPKAQKPKVESSSNGSEMKSSDTFPFPKTM